MLAPQDPLTGTTTPGSRSSDALLRSPQYDENSAAPSTSIVPSSARNPHAQPQEGASPSTNHPQAFSPSVSNSNVVSSMVSSSYISSPSPTLSQQSFSYPMPKECLSKPLYTHNVGTYQQQHQNPYQQTYQQYQRSYPEPIVHCADPVMVDTVGEKPTRPAAKISTSKSVAHSSGRRKRIIWIGGILTVILLGVAIGLVVALKTKDSSNSSLEEGGRVSAPPLPSPMPEKNKCPDFFCHNYFWETCMEACKEDSVYKSCKKECNGEFFCEKNCEKGERCFADCSTNLGKCSSVCFAR